MEEKQLRLLTVLAVILLALGTAYWIWEPSEEDDFEKDATEVIWEIGEMEEIRRIEAWSGQKKLVLVNENGQQWMMKEPMAYPADESIVNSLLRGLIEIDKGIPIDVKPEDVGLGESPKARFILTDGLNASHELVVGDEAPVGYRSYVLTSEGNVAAIVGNPTKHIDDFNIYRDTRLFAFDITNAKRIVLESEHGTLDVKREDTGWWLEGFTRADHVAVDDTLVGLSHLRFESFGDDLVPDGITDPRFTATVTEEGGKSHRIFVGAQTPMGTLVSVEGGTAGFLVEETLALLGQGPTDIGDERAFPFDPDTATSIDVALDVGGWKLEKSGDVWEHNGEENPAVPEAIDKVREVSIHYRREPVAALTEHWGKVQIEEADKPSRIIEIGQREGAEWRVAIDSAGGEPYLIPVGELEAIRGLF
jgi:hypothetical protein